MLKKTRRFLRRSTSKQTDRIWQNLRRCASPTGAFDPIVTGSTFNPLLFPRLSS